MSFTVLELLQEFGITLVQFLLYPGMACMLGKWWSRDSSPPGTRMILLAFALQAVWGGDLLSIHPHRSPGRDQDVWKRHPRSHLSPRHLVGPGNRGRGGLGWAVVPRVSEFAAGMGLLIRPGRGRRSKNQTTAHHFPSGLH